MNLLQLKGGLQPGGAGAAVPLNTAEVLTTLAIISAILFGVACLLVGLFLSMSKALRLCQERNRAMEPGQVWLNFIPCFHIYWSFKSVNAVSNSLRAEFASRRLDSGSTDYGKNMGVTCLAVWFIGNLISRGAEVIDNVAIEAMVAITFLLIWFVLFVLYWVKIAGFNKQLEAYGEIVDNGDSPSQHPRRDQELEDEEDERPRRRRRQDDLDDEDDSPH